MYTAEQLALHAEEIYNEKWLYGWGATGQRLQSIYKSLLNGNYYGVKHNNPTGFAILTAKYKAGENPKILDCYGQVDSLKMEVNDETVYNNTLDSTADNAFNYTKTHGVEGKDWGSIEKLPNNVRGIGLHRKGHYMTMIGPDRIVNIDSTGYPAKIITLAEAKTKRMVEWFKVPGIDYSIVEMPAPIVKSINYKVVIVPKTGLYRRTSPNNAPNAYNIYDRLVLGQSFTCDGITSDGWLHIVSGEFVESIYCTPITPGKLPLYKYTSVPTIPTWAVSSTLHYGDKSKDVYKVALALEKQGYGLSLTILEKTLKIAKYGNKMKMAVEKFQLKHPETGTNGRPDYIIAKKTVEKLGGKWIG